MRWTISNSPCTASTDDVVITFNQNPTTSAAGPDQTGIATCGSTSVTLAANAPTVGTGAWSIISGAGGSVTTPSSNTSTFTGTAGTTYTLRWTISNSPCTASTDDVVITFNRNPTTATNGSTQTICTSGTATLSGNNPSIGTGAWIVVSGPSTSSAQFASASVFNTVFTPAGGAGSYVVRWTISNSPCTASTADATITVSSPGTWLGGTSVDWNTASNWSCATVPTSSTNVTIPTGTTFSPNVSTASAVANSVTINASAALTMSGGNTLTISSGGSFTNNNTFNRGDGTVIFNGSGTITGTITFNNITLGGAVNFGSAVTVDGTLSINSGGSVTTNAPRYTSNSSLLYNTTGTFGRGLEWSATGTGTINSTVGYPNNVTVSNNTTVNYPNGAPTVARSMEGNLLINSGSSLFMDFGSPSTSGGLTVRGNVTVNGNLSLGDAIGGDLTIGGNYTEAASGISINYRGRAVIFNGTGTQVLTKTSGGTISYAGTGTAAYFIINKTAGSVQLATGTNVTLTQTAGDVFQINNVGSLNLNGQTFTMSGTGGNILATGANRSITGGTGSVFSITGNKTVTSASGGTLIFDTNVSLVTSANINFGASGITTVNGVLRLDSGYTVTNSPIYGSSSKLIYNSGGTPAISNEWTAASGTIGSTIGYPNDVDVQNGTTLTLSAIGSDRGLARNLTLGTGTTSSGSLTMGSTAQKLTVNGNLVIGGNTTSGTSTLTLSSNAASASIELRGNWTRNSTGVFTPAGRGVFFIAATGDQTITSSGGETFDFLIINKATSGNVVLANAATINQTLTLTRGLLVLGNNNVTFGSSGTTSSASTLSYMAVTGTGKVLKTHTGSFDYPVGPNTTNYAPVTINNTGVSQTYTIGVANTMYTPAIDGVNWQWSVAASGSSSSNLSFRWFTADAGSNIGTISSTVAQNFNGSSWSIVSSSTTASSPNTTTVNGVTNFTNTIWTVTRPCNGSTAAVLSGTATICSGASTNLQVAITGGSSPFTVIYSDGTTNFTVSSYTSSSNISVSPSSTNTYSLVSVADSTGCVGTGNSGTPTVTISATNTWTGTTSNDWNVASNWSCNAVPNSSTDAVIVSTTNSPEIGFSGTIAANCRNLTITSGTLTMSNASSLTLASTSTFSNSGSFVAGDGTVNFLGSGTITGTVVFNNINLSGLVSFSNAVTVNTRLRIASGGAVTNNSPTYGSSSLLQYFVGASYNRSLEWTTATSGAGYPANVQVSTNGTNTTVNMLTTVAQCSGNLTIDSGNTLNTTSNTLTVVGNVVIDGTMSLGGDVRTRGNWTVGASGTQTNNGRAVFFNGSSGNQTITRTSGTDVFFDYLIIDKTSGDVVISSSPATNVTINTNTGQVLQLNNTGRLDLNGRSLFLNNSGGSIYVNGARSIISSPISPNGTIEVNQYKFVGNNSGIGTLSLGATVTVNLNTNGNLDFGLSGGNAITTVNGILSINSNTNCFVNSNPPIYSNTSTLRYNCGGATPFSITYNRDREWTDISGAGYPNNVVVQGNTVLNVVNGNTAYKKAAGNLTIASGSRFLMQDANGPDADRSVVDGIRGIGVEFLGDITNNGSIFLRGTTDSRLKCNNFLNNTGATTSLIASASNVGADLEVTGNFTDNGNFGSNERAVFFTGPNTQTVSGTATPPFNIDYVVVTKPANSGVVLLQQNLLVGGPNGSAAIVFASANDIIDLNGNSLTVGQAGINSIITGGALGMFKGNSSSNLILNGVGDIGTISFDQTTIGTTNVLNSLTVNRTGTGGGFTLGSDVAISNTATLTAGTINLASANMTIGATATLVSSPVSTFSATKMIIASGTGELRKTFSAAGTFTYPIGDNVGTAEYSPATLTFTGSPSGYAGVRVQNAKHPNINIGITDFITRYWPVTSTISSPTCTASFTYLASDENGTGANYFGGRYLNPDWYCLSDVDDTNRVISSIVSAFGDFTVYTPPAMTSALTTSAATICANTSTNLQVAIGGGDSPYTVGPFTVVYFDSVSASNVTVNNYTSGSNITVSPTANSTYTLQSVTSSRACSSTASDAKTVNIGATTTYASSSWSPSAPTATSTAVIDGGVYNAAANITACSLEVKNNTVVTIPSTYKVTLSGALTVENGSSFTLENDSNLVQTDGTTNPNSGSIQVKRNSSSLYLLDYTLWSSPVENQNLSAFSPRTRSNRFYTYNEEDDQYNPIASSNNFAVAKGYLIRVPKDYSSTTPAIYNGVFTGKPNSGTITYPMSTDGTGFNAVGNPYPSQINVHNFIDTNISNITGVLYFWRKKNDFTQPSYATLTKLGYAANSAPGGGTTNTANYFNTSNNAANTWVINVGQGFFVQATAATDLVFTNAMRRGVNNSNQFFRTSNEITSDVSLYKLNLTSNNGFFSQMLVGYSSEYTLGVDKGIDGLNINTDLYISSSIDGVAYAIQGRPEFTPADIVPLQYKIATADEYSITIEQFDGLFGTQDVFIKDKLTNFIHNLKTGPYTFVSETGTFTDRFEVVYENPLSTSDPKFNQNNVLVYKQNQEVIINTGKVQMSNVKIYDVRGRLLVTKSNINASQVKMYTGTTQQVLIVKITSDKNDVVTKKVIN